MFSEDYQSDDVDYCDAEQKRKTRLLKRCKKDCCPVCYKYIRSDNIKGNIRRHKDICSKPETEWSKELREFKKKLERLEEIAYRENVMKRNLKRFAVKGAKHLATLQASKYGRT